MILIKKLSVFIIIFCILNFAFCINLSAQVAINTTGATADASAILDVNATNQGILIPRLTTTQRNLLPSPATGLLIYNTSINLFNYYNGNKWYEIGVTFVSLTTGTVRPGGGVSINVTNTSPDSSAILDVNDPSRGILVPRPTGAIAAPATGLIIYNTSTNRFNYYNGSVWIAPCATSTGVSGATGSQSYLGTAFNTSGSLADSSAILDVSAVDKGMLIPRLTTTDRNNIKAVTGLIIYNTTTNAIEYYNSSGWYMLEYNIPSITATPSSQTICSGNVTGITLTSDVSGATFAWTVTQSGVTGAFPNSGSSIAQTLTNSGTTEGTATYSITPTLGSCIGTSTNVVITINPTLSQGVIGSAQTICYGATPSALIFTTAPLGGNSSYTYQWQSTTNCSSPSWSNVGTNNTYSPPALNTTTCYRCNVSSCGETKATNTVTIAVNPTLTAGIIGSNQTICSSSTPSLLTFTTAPSGGNSNYTYQWQSTTNCGSPSWSNAGTNNTYSPPALTATTCYRCNVSSCGETKATNTVTITVSAVTIATITTTGNWTVPAGVTSVDVTVVGGGGGGADGYANGSSCYPAAGGGGGYLNNYYGIIVTSGNGISVVIGGGGSHGHPGSDGNPSSFGIYTANGGKAPVGAPYPYYWNGGNGGSGGATPYCEPCHYYGCIGGSNGSNGGSDYPQYYTPGTGQVTFTFDVAGILRSGGGGGGWYCGSPGPGGSGGGGAGGHMRQLKLYSSVFQLFSFWFF